MITFLFMEGLRETLKGLVKSFDPPTLQDIIKRTLTLVDSTISKTKYMAPYHRPSIRAPSKKDTSPPRRDSSSERSTLIPPITYRRRTKDEMNEINELIKKNLCFSFK